MNTGTAPVITLTGSHWGAQTGGTWTTTTNPDDTYTATLTHDGTEQTISNVVASIAQASGAKDLVGNDEVGATSASFLIDTKKPTLTSVSIASDYTTNNSLSNVGNIVTITIVASENIQSPTVTIDSNAVTPSGSGTQWTVTKTMQSGDTNGQIPFSIDFEDTSGNDGITRANTDDGSYVVFDNTPPANVELIEQSTTGDTFRIYGSADDNFEIKSASLKVTGDVASVDQSVVLSESRKDLTFEFNITVNSNAEAVQYTLTIEDLLGNKVVKGPNPLAVLDNDAPEVSTPTQPDQEWYNSDIPVSVAITDNINVREVKAVMERAGFADIEISLASPSPFTGNFVITTLPDGNYTLRIKAQDDAKNENASVTVENINVDDTLPVINYLISDMTDNITKSGASVVFTLEVIELNVATVTLTAGTQQTMTPAGGNLYTYTGKPADLGCTAGQETTCTVTATVVDMATNSDTIDYSFRVDDLNPRITINAEDPAIMYNDDSVTISATIVDSYLNNVIAYEDSTGTMESRTPVDAGNGVYTYLIPAANLENMETVSYSFYAVDDEGNELNLPGEFTVNNRDPVYDENTPIDDRTILEGLKDSFNIAGSFYDLDIETLVYDHSHVVAPPEGDYTIDIDANGQVTITPINLDYFGVTSVIFTATDPYGRTADSRTVTITYTNVNDKPYVLTDIPDVEFSEGESDNSIFLNQYFRDPDEDPIFWSWEAIDENKVISENILVDIDEITTQVTITTTPDYYGVTALTFFANDGGLGGVGTDTIELIVTNVNDDPVIDELSLKNESILNLTLVEDFITFTFDLTPYESDVDLYDTDENLTWSISDVDETLVTITLDEATDVLTFERVEDQFGTDTFTLTLTDSFDATHVVDDFTINILSVNDGPEINTAPLIDPAMETQYTTEEDKSFTINLKPYELDADPYDTDEKLVWSVTEVDETLISVEVDEIKDVIMVYPLPDISGGPPDEILLTLTDSFNATAKIRITITVLVVNDPPTIPVLTEPADLITVYLDETTLRWDASTDVDNDAADITYNVYHGEQGTELVEISTAQSTTDFLVSGLIHEASYDWYIIASDGTDETQSSTFSYVVSIQNPPNITDHSPIALNVDMGETGSQQFSVAYDDIDDGDAVTIDWTLDGEYLDTNSFVTIDSVSVPGLSEGVHNVTATAIDSFGLTDSVLWTLTVSNTPYTENKYTGTIFDLTEGELAAASGVTIEEATYGSIDFGTNTLNLMNVISIDSSVLIEPGVIGIDTERYSQLNKSAHIVMKGLSFVTEPVIFYNEGFGAVGNTVCPSDLCTNVNWDSQTGTLEFDVAHFSTFFTRTNNRPVVNAGQDQNVDVDDVVTLDGSGSSDPDVNDTLTYLWEQVSGTDVALSSYTAEKPTFTPTEAGTYVFQLVVNDGIVDSSADNVTVTAFGGVLDITKVRLESDGTNNRLKPGETLIVEVDIENKAEFDIEDIQLEVWFEDSSGRKLEDDDNDDIEDDSEFDLDEGDDEGDVDDDDVIFEFEMPYDVDDNDEYIVYVRAEGEQGNDSSIKYMDLDTSKTIKFEREKHELVIYKAVLNPDSVKCSRNVVLDIGVRDIGEKDEDDVRLTIINSELDVNVVDTFDIEEDADDNEFRSSYSFKAADEAGAGLYPIFIRVEYDEGDETVTETVNLEVEDCVRVVEVKEDVIVQKIDDVTALPAVTEPVPKVTRISFTQTPEYMLVLALGVVMLTGMVIFLLGAVIIGLRR